MAKIIGVKFKNTAKIYYFAPASEKEVYEKNLYNGIEHLNKVVQRQENYLSDLKLLYNVTSDEALKSLEIGCALW